MHSGIIKVFIIINITRRTYLVTFFAHGQEDQLLQLLLKELAHKLITFVNKRHQFLNRHLFCNLFDKRLI